jgi:hypothetical protein
MDLSGDEVQQRAETDRREVNPPTQVQRAILSIAGELEWWVRERQEWWVGYAVATVVSGGSELLIFVRPKRADNRAGFVVMA